MRPGFPYTLNKTVYLVVRSGAQYVRSDTGAVEAFDSAHWANYLWALTDPGNVGYYDRATLTNCPDGTYDAILAYEQAGASPSYAGDTADGAVWVWQQQQVASGLLVDSVSVTLSTQDKQDISDAVVAGIGTVGGLTDEQAAQLTDSYNKLQSMGANVLNVVSPVAEDGTVTLYQGDDYLLADAGRPLEFTITDYAGPDLTGAAVTFKLARHGKYAIGSAAVSAELTVTSGTMAVAGSTVTIRVPLTSAQTAALTPTGDVAPNYQYHLVATTASGSVLTEAVGGCVVRKRIS